MTTYKTNKMTHLYLAPSRKQEQPPPHLLFKDNAFLKSASTTVKKETSDNNEVFLNVVLCVPGTKPSDPCWVPEADCDEIADVRPELQVDGFIRSCLIAEQNLNNLDSFAPWFVVADFVIARAIIENGDKGSSLANSGPMITGSDAVGPLQVTSAEWDDFLKSAGAVAKEFISADRDDPQLQCYGAAYRMHADAKAISNLKLAKGVGTDKDPFLPSYLDLFHAYLTNSPEAAIAIRDAEDAATKDKTINDKKINETLKGLNGPLTDDQIAALFKARGTFMGAIETPKTLGEFIAATDAALSAALKGAYELIKQYAPDCLPPPITQGEAPAPWFDVAQKEEAQRIHEPDDLPRILDYFKATRFDPEGARAPWCGAFAAFCMKATGNAVPKDAAAAASWKGWGQAIPFQSGDIPQGAIIVLSPSEGTGTSGHVSFFVEFDADGQHVLLLGGNQHHAVNRTRFLKSRIAAARWADAALPQFNPPSGQAAKILGDIMQLANSAKPIGLKFKDVTSLGTLPGGPLIFNSALQLDTDGSDVGLGDRTHQNQTSYRYADGSSINANKVPFFVLPQKSPWVTQLGIKLGDLAAVVYKDKLAFAAFADFGPQTKLGEGSIELHRRLGFERVKGDKVSDIGIDPGVITIVFPSSGLPSRPSDQQTLLAFIDSQGPTLFQRIGGKIT